MATPSHPLQGATPADLLVAPSGWRYAPTLVLRSAGFPLDDALALAAPAARALLETNSRHPEYGPCLEQGTAQADAAMRRVIGGALFREAVQWQSPPSAEYIDKILETAPGSQNSKYRRRIGTLANYLQRYAAKNDTIGFFGPVCWARWVPEAIHLRSVPGAALLRSRQVFLEHWAVQALADELAREREILLELAPRLLPSWRVDDASLIRVGQGEQGPKLESFELDGLTAAALALVDGRRPAREVLAALTPAAADEVEAVLEALVEQGVVAWSLEVPFAPDLRHDRALARLLARLPASPARSRAESTLGTTLQLVHGVETAAGDPAMLRQRLGELEVAFRAATARSASRRTGGMYSARELVFEQCVRDHEVELGTALLDQLDAALSLVLCSARWACWRVTSLFHERFLAALRRLPGDREGVDLALLLAACREDFSDSSTSPIGIVAAELRAAWTSILGIAPDLDLVRIDPETIRAAVEARFAAPSCGFPHARVHSPDIMVAARDPEAFARGDYALILGEVHVANDTVFKPMFTAALADPAGTLAVTRQFYEGPLLEWVVPRGSEIHTVQVSCDPEDYSVEMDPAPSWRSGERTVRLADLLAVERGGVVRVVSRDGRVDVDAVEFASFELSAHIGDIFGLGEGPRRPRIQLGNLVVARRTWRFAGTELAAARVHDPVEQFRAMNEWALGQGLPRWVFVKTAEERKPVFVDLASPTLLSNACRMLREASIAVFSEMLPAPDETWLRDAQGRCYTSELRIAVVEPSAPRR